MSAAAVDAAREALAARCAGPQIDGALFRDLGGGSWVALCPARFPDFGYAEREGTRQDLGLRREAFYLGGREVESPRLVAYLARDAGPGARTYGYAGRRFRPTPFPTRLDDLRRETDYLCGARPGAPLFDACVANLYETGRDSVGWHADDEPEVGPRPPDATLVASISFGARRRFLIRRKADHRDRHVFALGAGDLLVMGGACQRDWEHSVPKTTRPCGPRLNLTFRVLSPQGSP